MTMVLELSTWVGLSIVASAVLSRRWLILSVVTTVSAALAFWAFVRLTRGTIADLQQLDVVAIVAAGLGALLAATGMQRLQQSAEE